MYERLFGTPWTVACQAALCMGFLRQEHWSKLPFSSLGDLPDPGMEPASSTSERILYHLSHLESPHQSIFFLKIGTYLLKGSVQFSSVTQSCPIRCEPMDCSTPGFHAHHQLLGPTQTHVHHVGDAIQPPHPLSSPSPTFSLSQHQGLFQWTGSSHQVAKVLALQLQNQSFQWIFRTDFLRMDSNSLLDLLVVQGTLKSLPQHHSLKVSVL